MTITHGLSAAGGAILNTGTLTLTDVAVTNNSATVTGGTNAFPEGGGIRNGGGATVNLILSTVSGNTVSASAASSQNDAAGGGILSNGTLTLDRSTVSSNTASATGTATGFSAAVGGGITTSGVVTVTRSTIDGNTASASGSAMANGAQGAGLSAANNPAVNVSLDRTTIAGNTATAAGTSPSASAGGIGADGSTLTVTSSTISGNSAPLYANLKDGATTPTIKNSIVANPLGGGANCSTTSNGSLGYNLDSANSCGFNQTGDQANTDPLLASSLADNGGPTQTLLPQPNSPAIDKGLSSGGEAVDQRGLQRPWQFDIADAPGGDGTDIGAVEIQGPVPTGTTPTSPDNSPSPNVFGTRERQHRSALQRRQLRNAGDQRAGGHFRVAGTHRRPRPSEYLDDVLRSLDLRHRDLGLLAHHRHIHELEHPTPAERGWRCSCPTGHICECPRQEEEAQGDLHVRLPRHGRHLHVQAGQSGLRPLLIADHLQEVAKGPAHVHGRGGECGGAGSVAGSVQLQAQALTIAVK
jgi:hypothetical protein